MPAVPDSPGLLTLPNAEGANAVSAPAPNVDRSFTKYGEGALTNLRAGSRLIAAHELEEAKKARESRALDAANEFYIRSMGHLVGENGALLQGEADVTAGVDGKSFTEFHTGELDKISRDILGRLDPETRKAAEGKISNFRRGFIGQLFTHEGAEFQKALLTASKTAANVAADQVVHGQNLGGAFGTILEQYTQIADRNGVDLNNPDAKYAIRRDAQIAYSKALDTHLDALIAQENPYGAASALRAAATTGGLDANSLAAMRKKVNDAVEAHVVKTQGKLGSATMIAEKTPTALLGRALPMSAEMVGHFADASGLPNDEAHTAQRTQAALEAAITQFGGEDGAMVALSFESPERLKDAQEAAEQKYGRDKVSPANLEDFMTPAEKGRLTKARSYYKDNYGSATHATTGEVYAMARRLAPKGASEELIGKIAVQIASDMQKAEQMRDVKSSAAVHEVIRRMDNGDVGLVGVDLSALSPTQRSQLDRLRHNYLSKVEASDTVLFMELMENTQRLAGMGETDFALLKADLSPQDWGMLDNARRAILGTGGPASGDVKLDNVRNAVERFAVSNNLDLTSDEGRLRKAALIQIGIDAMRPAAKLRGAKNPLTQEDYDSTIEKALGSVQRTHSNAFFSLTMGGKSPLAAMKPSDINPTLVSALAKCQGLEADVFKKDDPRILYLYHKYIYNPTAYVPEDAVPAADRMRIVQEYRATNGGRTPDARSVFFIYAMKQQGDFERLKAFGIKAPASEAPAESAPRDLNDAAINDYDY